ncbi:hypothetical protein STEG23_001727 [Scotinomys teguina]
MVNSFLHPIQRMLKQRDLKVSDRTIKGFLEDIDQAAQWFRASGDVNLPCWEKLGWDLTEAKGRGELRPGTLPLWCLIRYCLKDGKCIDILHEGRRALSAHQDSMSESDNKERGNLKEERPKSSKASSKLHTKVEKEKETDQGKKEKETDQGKTKQKPSGLYPVLDEFKQKPSGLYPQKPSGLYLVLDEFADLTLSDSAEDELDSEEEEDGKVEADPKMFPVLTLLRERRDFGITAAIVAAIALSAASAITAAVAMTNQIQTAQTINTVVEQTSAVMETQHRINKHLISGIVAANQRMDLIQTQIEELFGLVQIRCIAKLKHMCVTPLRFDEAGNESRMISSYLAGNWTRDAELLMSQQLLQIAALNETRVEPISLGDFTDWLSSAFSFFKEWVGVGIFGAICCFGVVLRLWLLCRVRARQARDKAVIIQALAALEHGVSPQEDMERKEENTEPKERQSEQRLKVTSFAVLLLCQHQWLFLCQTTHSILNSKPFDMHMDVDCPVIMDSYQQAHPRGKMTTCTPAVIKSRLFGQPQQELGGTGVDLGRNQPLKKEKPKWKNDYPMTDGQLRSKRDEFWDTAPAFEGRKEIWDALKPAAYAFESNDHELAQAIIDGANITLPHGALTECYDELGKRYQLSVYCLAPPINMIEEKSDIETLDIPEPPPNSGHESELRLRLSTGKDLKLVVCSTDTVFHMKRRLHATDGVEPSSQRWFFSGRPLTDKMKLEELKIPKDYMVQVVVSQPVQNPTPVEN